MAKLAICGVSKRFQGRNGTVCALENICLEVQEGEFLVLIGPSGCGKSTLLNIIAGLDPADAGEVREDGRPVWKPGRDRSVVFQDGALFPWLTAQKNVEFPLKQMGLSARERAERAAYYLHLVHLSRFRENYLHELSGGMRQRVAIARALALEPEVLLMDEPFSALDAQTREDLYVVLQEIWQRTGKTIVFVTHNVREAVCLADRVVLLSARPGRVQAEFPIQLSRPRFIEDVDVARIAHQISCALKEGIARVRQEEYDEDWQPAEAGVFRAAGGVMGDSI
ncbi:MAG TPA: ABC transporter ATP-binding protein [Chthonomonadaceae bacterium]|nr:ABC transporter ATP-binding protein [Chthonomonadaceae bacterium]